MAFDVTKYVRLWPWSQFVGLELLVGALVWQRWHPTSGDVVAFAACLVSAFAFAYQVNKNGVKSLLNIRRALQAIGYAAILYGLIRGGEFGAVVAFLGSGVAMAGFVYDLIYP